MKVLNFSTVNYKNLVLNPLLSLSPLLVIIVGIFASYGRANAEILGELKISGTLDVESLGEFIDTDNPLIPIGLDSTVPDARKLSVTSFDFHNLGAVANDSFGEFLINEGNGEFKTVNPTPVLGGVIKDLPPFPRPFSNDSISNFLDLAFDANSGSKIEFNIDFDLTELTGIEYMDAGDGVVNGISVHGIWNIKDDQDNIIQTRPGKGTISAEITYDAIPQVNNFEEYLSFISQSGNRIEGIAFSGDFILEENPNPTNTVSIPEPLSIISLIGSSIVSVGFLASKKRPENIN